MKKRTTKAPPITRVHKLFRLRTVVNEIPKYTSVIEDGIDTESIGKILVDNKLSKSSILDSADKLKRARDHALNCSILGLTIPIHRNHGYKYIKSPIGELLSVYDFDNECPYDLHETSIFSDRMMRLKLTNAYDSRRTYSKFHTRPILSILSILKYRPLHITHIHYLLSINKDIILNDLTKSIIEKLSKYDLYEDSDIDKFLIDFKLSDKRTLNEIGRSTKPLIDWAYQSSLLTFDSNGWCIITENGKEIQNYYSNYIPIWYDQLGFNAPLQAAILLTYQHAYENNFEINYKKFSTYYKDTFSDLKLRYNLWNKRDTKLVQPLDFSIYYDVPYDVRKEVNSYLIDISKKLKIKMNPYLLSINSIYEIEKILQNTGRETDFVKLNEALGIKIPRRECFQTELEWQVCISLRTLKLPAFPYKGEFEGETDSPMATDNPDIVIKNSFRTLVECKSSREWGEKVKFDKRVFGELSSYQDYVTDIDANSALFVCDVKEFSPDLFIDQFIKRANKLNKIVVINYLLLKKYLNEPTSLQILTKILEKPEEVPPKNRILSV